MSGKPVAGEVLGGTSFAGMGSSSAATIELIGSASASGSLAGWSVRAYRVGSSDASAAVAAIGSSSWYVKKQATGSADATTVTSVAASVMRSMVPLSQSAEAVIDDVTIFNYLKPTGLVTANAETAAALGGYIRTTGSATAAVSTASDFGILTLLIPTPQDCSAAVTAVAAIHVPFDSTTSASAAYAVEALRKYFLDPADTDAGSASAAFVVEISNSATPEERVMVVPYESRLMEASDMGILGTYYKQPAETLDYEIDFGEFLPSDDPIENSLTPPVIDISPTGLTQVGSAIVTDQVVKLWFSGGTDRTSYKVTVTVTTAQGRVKQNEFRIKVKDV